MNKYILISFGFIGWAFYELSGGDDFEPASVRMAHLLPKAEAKQVADAPADEPEVTQTAFIDTDPPLASNEVTRVALNLTALEGTEEAETTANDVRPEPVAPAQEEITVTTLDTSDGSGVPQNIGSVSQSADTPAIIPSLIVPNAETTQVAVSQPASAFDVRTVTGNRVNVRGGPGTDFGVVSQLVRGDEVEVLEDNGNGWVRMRPLAGESDGWMADFLLSDG